ncbi:MAG: cryptochrome/photolyase family protein [Patescibacteria group bacterium]
MKSALILYPNQLYSADLLPEVQTVFTVEDPYFFGADPQNNLAIHKQKIILLRASLRRYVKEVLWPAGYDVQHVGYGDIKTSEEIFLKTKGFEKLYIFDPTDNALSQRLLQARRETAGIAPLEFLPSPNFFLSEHEVRDYFGKHQTSDFDDFYQWQRERFNILIDENYKPLGGKWIFDQKQVKSVKNDVTLPSIGVFGGNNFVEEATNFVNKNFNENPGSTEFVWPTNHQEAEDWLQNFLKGRAGLFSEYKNSLHPSSPWLFHSALSPILNIGLLQPQQVVTAILYFHKVNPLPIEALESFIRGILGWREYQRGLYLVHGQQLKTSNSLKHLRLLSTQWSNGGLNIPPYDDVVNKLLQRGYIHHNERLMVVGNLMLISQIHPDEVYKWFMQLCIDAYDWCVVGNVYAMSQMAEGGQLVNRPPFSPSNYITQSSEDYQRGEWSDVWDGLFWDFVENHKESFKSSPELRAATHRLSRLDADHRRIIGYRAQDFLARATRQ